MVLHTVWSPSISHPLKHYLFQSLRLEEKREHNTGVLEVQGIVWGGNLCMKGQLGVAPAFLGRQRKWVSRENRSEEPTRSMTARIEDLRTTPEWSSSRRS